MIAILFGHRNSGETPSAFKARSYFPPSLLGLSNLSISAYFFITRTTPKIIVYVMELKTFRDQTRQDKLTSRQQEKRTSRNDHDSDEDTDLNVHSQDDKGKRLALVFAFGSPNSPNVVLLFYEGQQENRWHGELGHFRHQKSYLVLFLPLFQFFHFFEKSYQQ